MYTASLAMSSMVGYVIGLGDRHLENIMIKGKMAKLVHTDFSACFDVARHRAKYPEKVPFRLTKMLVNALEATKIEGTFRCCCENIMKLMRHNREQIIGLLETFIFDPLLQWIDVNSSQQNLSIEVISCMKAKLEGLDEGNEKVPVKVQVDKLIKEATDYENLAQMYPGWCPWW